ncbi:hypothetical protein G5B38_06475 [Pseudohalocynthiibacter aestuariivivens]|nr:glycine betaine ABC transporter substrate-binding protein [Pseudohalocynthiibacter aestuariivivens]QIE45197.1 hypothetical protein G5B38_06475 [Pseudohalocynthiibacter aestuariivivens]
MKTTRRILLLATCAMMAGGSAAMADVETRKPIKVLMINSADGDFMAAVYGEILREVGYRVDYVQADYAASFTAVASGDIDVSLAAWQTTGVELTKAAVDSGQVTDYGPTGVLVTEGWWYSNALKEFCPGLPDWNALKEPGCVKALETAETAPKGRYLDAPADWGTLSDATIEDLDLELAVINSGSPGTLVAAVKGALDRQEPILAWGYLPHWLYNTENGEFVELPGFQRDLDILKLGYDQTFDRAKMAGEILSAYTISTEAVAVGMDAIDNNGMTAEEAAQAWMSENESTWQAWVPE